MTCTSLDLTIDKVLADPVIAAAMRADHVDPRRFEDLLRATARDLGSAPRSGRRPVLADDLRGTSGFSPAC